MLKHKILLPLRNSLKRNLFSSLEQIQTKIERTTEVFQFNSNSMSEQLSQLDKTISKILECGGKSTNEKHVARGKLLVRDRIDRIIDAG